MAKILISDDNKDFVELLESLLVSHGYQIAVAHDGDEAITKLKKYDDFDLVITDIIMPGSDGFDVIKFARENTKAKIIAVSGGGVFLSSKTTTEALKDLADVCLQKPVKIDEFMPAIKNLLEE